MTSRATRIGLDLFFVAWLMAAGVVVGFCFGGLLGERLFGARGGHGLGNLGYLFDGAFLGGAAGAVVSGRGILAWEPRRRWRVAVGLTLAAVLVGGGTWLRVNLFGGW